MRLFRLCTPVSACVLVLLALAGCSSAAAPPAAKSQTAQSAAPGTVCGIVNDPLGGDSSIQVTVLSGNVTCSGALSVARAYFGEPPADLKGSGAFATIGLWTCESWPGSVYASTGHGGECTTKGESAVLSLDRPGTKAVPISRSGPP